MVRTVGTTIKSIGGKSSKGAGLSGGSSFGSGGLRSSRRPIGGNKLVQRPVPLWQKPIGSFFVKSESNSTSPVTDNVNPERRNQCSEECYDEQHAEIDIKDEDKENQEQTNNRSEVVVEADRIIERTVDMFDGTTTHHNISENDEILKSSTIFTEDSKYVDAEVNIAVPKWQKPIGDFFVKSESNSTSPEIDDEERERRNQSLEKCYDEQHAEFYSKDVKREVVVEAEEIIERTVGVFDGTSTHHNVSEDDKLSKSSVIATEPTKDVDAEVNIGASTSSYKPVAAPRWSPLPAPKRKVAEQQKTEAEPAKKRKIRPQYHLLEKIEREYSNV